MCMTLLLSEPTIRAIASGTCQLEFTNFTECVVTYVVKRTRMRFSGVISTAVLHYVEVSSETRLSVYVPQLCLGLLVMIVNGWLLVTLQNDTYSTGRISRTVVTHPSGSSGQPKTRFSSPIRHILFSLTLGHCVHGAVTVYQMTSMVITSATSSNTRYRNQAIECLSTNSFLFVAIFSVLFHHMFVAFERFHSIKYSVSYRMFWTASRTWTCLGVIWFVSLICGMLPLFGWRTKFPYCIFFYQYPRGYYIFVATIYFVCLSVICFGYTFVFLTTRKPSGVTFNSKCSRVRRRREAQLTVTVAIMASVSVILWTPLFLHLVLACPDCLARTDNEFALLGVFAFVLTNSLFFPLIYACRVKQLRYFVSAILRQCEMCNLKRKSGSFELNVNQRRRRRRNNRQLPRTRPSLAGPRISMLTEPQTFPCSQPELPSSGSGNGDILY